MKPHKGMLLVVSGPSGAGKSTILTGVMNRRDDMFFSVSATTRAPRPGEEEGEHYFFCSKDKFREMREKGELLEFAEYAGNEYGTPKAPVEERLKSGAIVVLDIETRGAMQVMEHCPDAVSVFITPPGTEETERRLRSRGTETEERIQERMRAARNELLRAGAYQYLVVNDTLEEAVDKLDAIVRAELCRMGRVRFPV